MENLNVVNDTQQAVVESASGGGSSGTPVSAANAELTARTQSARENSGFRRLRLENEQYKRELDELRKKIAGAERLERENKTYLDKLVGDRMKKDLDAIRKLDPSVQSLESLGDDFIGLIEHGIDASVAFSAIKQATDGKVSQSPPRTGAVGASGERTDRYYSSKELDRLTARDLENPAIYKKAIESLKRL